MPLSVSFYLFCHQLARGASFTSSIPIRKDIDGSPEQVFKYQHFVDSFIASIEAGTIAAIGKVNPKVYKNLQGMPTTIVGNSSDTIGEYSLLRVDISCLKNFAHIDCRLSFDAALVPGTTIPDRFLQGTRWKDETVPVAAVILPNFFPIYFGQRLVYGDLHNEETRSEFDLLGTGYGFWADSAFWALQHFADTSTVIDAFAGDESDPNNAKDFDANIKLYLATF